MLAATAGLIFGMMLFFSATHRLRIAAAIKNVNARTAERHLVQHGGSSVSLQQADPCSEDAIMPNTELWGAVVVAGHNAVTGKGLTASSAVECCRACNKQKGCNRWVWCHASASCDTQCWLKRTGDPVDTQASQAKGMSVVWTSGVVPKDYDINPDTLPPVNTSISEMIVTTSYGKIRIKLKPEWSESSVAYVRRLAAMPELCSSACQFYRAEPGFLLQGSMRSYIPANQATTLGPKFMERGDIGWAGGGAGPDWFIYLGEKPATHWGFTHTVWGCVEDKASLELLEKLVRLPATAPKPNDMHMLNEPIDFSTSAA